MYWRENMGSCYSEYDAKISTCVVWVYVQKPQVSLSKKNRSYKMVALYFKGKMKLREIISRTIKKGLDLSGLSLDMIYKIMMSTNLWR